MAEVTIKIPEDIKDIIDGITEPLYVEALREIARKRFAYNQKTLKEEKAESLRQSTVQSFALVRETSWKYS